MKVVSYFSVWKWSLFLAKVVTVSFESCHCFLCMLSEENVDRVSGECAGVCVGFVLREFQVISVIPLLQPGCIWLSTKLGEFLLFCKMCKYHLLHLLNCAK